LRSLLGSGITAHAILEILQSCAADAPAVEMSQILRLRDFDVAGVQENKGTPVIGFVAREDLQRGMVKDHTKPLMADCLVSESTPLPRVLAALRKEQRYFVLIGPEVRGIITRADLNKPPVRVYLFGLLSLLEMHLGFWVRHGYDETSWQTVLKVKRVEAAQKVREGRRAHGDVPLLDCLQFCDKRDLIVAREDLRNRMSLGTVDDAVDLLRRAEALRNLLAHSQQDLVQGSSWEKTIDLVASIEAIVLASDQEVEEVANRSAERGDYELFSPA
jgi:hypothetical protein